MLRDFKFFGKYYVGIEKSRYKNTDNQRLLGFATPIEANAAYAKRKETVDRWRNTSVEPLIIDNVPTFGFEIVDVVSRYRTDNKLYRIFDPRGFELEISAENLFDILMNNTVVKAKIMEPLVWARFNSKNYLVSAASEEYKNYLSPKKEVPDLAPGQYFRHLGNPNIVYRYEGRFHGVKIEQRVDRYNPVDRRSYWGHSHTPNHKKQTRGGIQTHVKYDWTTAGKEPYVIYTEFHLDTEGNAQTYQIHLRKSKLKDLDYIGDSYDNTTVSSFELPVGQYLGKFANDAGGFKLDNGHRTPKVSYVTNGYSSDPDMRSRELILFNTRAEANAHTFDIKAVTELMRPLNRYAYDYTLRIYVEPLVQDYNDYGTVFYELFKGEELIEEAEDKVDKGFHW